MMILPGMPQRGLFAAPHQALLMVSGVLPRGTALLMAGNTGAGTFQSTTIKYNLTSDAQASGGAVNTGRDGCAASSSTTKGYLVSGYNGADTAVTSIYTFSLDTAAVGTSLLLGRYCTGTGNATTGIFSRGLANTGEYIYSTDVVTARAALPTNNILQTSTGNDALAIFAGGSVGGPVSALTYKFTYATLVMSAGTSLSVARQGLNQGTIGTNVFGLIGGGDTSGTLVNRYTYSGDVVTTATSLGVARYLSEGASDHIAGVFASGNATITSTDKYTFAGDVVAAGSTLATHRVAGAACSSAPGHF